MFDSIISDRFHQKNMIYRSLNFQRFQNFVNFKSTQKIQLISTLDGEVVSSPRDPCKIAPRTIAKPLVYEGTPESSLGIFFGMFLGVCFLGVWNGNFLFEVYFVEMRGKLNALSRIHLLLI